MNRNVGLILVATLGVAAYLMLRREESVYPNEPIPSGDDPWFPGDDMPTHDIEAQRLAAFLFMLRAAETGLLRARDGSAYHVFYGGSTFDDLSGHPVKIGVKAPVRLSAQMCRNVGFSSGVCFSTAAGAYQITVPTYDDFSRRGYPIDDFSPESQDELAVRILNSQNAIPYIVAGDFEQAVRLASPRWASLPYSTAQQSPKSLDIVRAYYEEGLRGIV